MPALWSEDWIIMAKKQPASPAQPATFAVEAVPFDEALLADPFYASQTIAIMYKLPFIAKPPAQPKGGDMTPEELAAFTERQERVQRESRDWPLPGTEEWGRVRAEGEMR